MKTTILIVSVILFLFFIYFLVTYKKRKLKREIRKKIAADGESDFAITAKNIAMSISKSKELYKSLITQIHPDRFLDERKIKATELSARITRSKKNYNELITIQLEVDEFLNEKK